MKATLKRLLVLILLIPWVANAAGTDTLGPKADMLRYRCEVITIYAQLHEISYQYGSILINEDEINIYQASKDAVLAFEEISGELETIYVPGQVNEPHQVLIKSVNSYTEIARNIEKALGIFIGEYEGDEQVTYELLDKSEAQADLGNKYLKESLGMHQKLFVMDGEVSKSCKKYVASVSH